MLQPIQARAQPRQRPLVGIQLVLQLEDLAPQPPVLGQQRRDRVLEPDDADGQRAVVGRRRQAERVEQRLSDLPTAVESHAFLVKSTDTGREMYNVYR